MSQNVTSCAGFRTVLGITVVAFASQGGKIRVEYDAKLLDDGGVYVTVHPIQQ
jgi:hypothetical protein